MLSRKDICALIVSGSIGLAGCGSSEHSPVKKSALEYQQSAESSIIAHWAILDYDRAHYQQLLSIVEVNNSFLRANRLEIDVSEYVKKAEEYHRKAEARWIIAHWAIMDYKRAQYEISKAIIKQQHALKSKMSYSPSVSPANPETLKP